MTDIQHHTLEELWRQSSDNANEPFILQTGSLFWNGSAWEKWTGGDTEDTDTATTTSKVDVGAISTSVLAAKADRISTIIVNDSNEEVYINLSGTAVMNEGIRLNAHGGALVEKNYTGAITAICASGTKNITVTQL